MRLNDMPNSSVEKPAKPTPDFPLFTHATKRWAKKIRGKLHYFGPWDDPDGALALYDKQKGWLHAGQTPPPAQATDDTKTSANGKGATRMKQRKQRKPPKPSSDFPLFPHASGQWAKKIRGRLHYFGLWDNPDGALARYNEHKEELHSGRLKKVPTAPATKTSPCKKPAKPTPDFPLFPHSVGQWAKKINGKTYYFGPWDDPDGALASYESLVGDRQPRGIMQEKPRKPHKDFPLFPHASGQWAKKIRGRLHYFGPWEDSNAALDKYLAQKDDLLAGRIPRVTTEDGCTVRELVNKFLASKEQLVESGELTKRSFDDYYRECEKTITVLGRHRMVEDLTPDDFERLRAELAKTLGPVALGNAVNRVRSLFKYAYEQYLIDKPVRYGQTFKRPSATVLRKERNKKGPRMFEAEQIQDMLDATSRSIKAMILLGINCGFGNNDCATLPRDVLDLENGWVNFPRPKTGIQRRCPLWPETIAALRDAMAHMPAPKDEADAGLVFITKYGMNWSDGTRRNPITSECGKLLRQLGLNRPGLGFYALRHTFQTIGEECRDLVAVRSIMGHAPPSNDMSSLYREKMTDDRLRAVTDHIRGWLFDG